MKRLRSQPVSKWRFHSPLIYFDFTFHHFLGASLLRLERIDVWACSRLPVEQGWCHLSHWIRIFRSLRFSSITSWLYRAREWFMSGKTLELRYETFHVFCLFRDFRGAFNCLCNESLLPIASSKFLRLSAWSWFSEFSLVPDLHTSISNGFISDYGAPVLTLSDGKSYTFSSAMRSWWVFLQAQEWV